MWTPFGEAQREGLNVDPARATGQEGVSAADYAATMGSGIKRESGVLANLLCQSDGSSRGWVGVYSTGAL